MKNSYDPRLEQFVPEVWKPECCERTEEKQAEDQYLALISPKAAINYTHQVNEPIQTHSNQSIRCTMNTLYLSIPKCYLLSRSVGRFLSLEKMIKKSKHVIGRRMFVYTQHYTRLDGFGLWTFFFLLCGFMLCRELKPSRTSCIVVFMLLTSFADILWVYRSRML